VPSPVDSPLGKLEAALSYGPHPIAALGVESAGAALLRNVRDESVVSELVVNAFLVRADSACDVAIRLAAVDPLDFGVASVLTF
jgi:hypothetical protein